MHSRTRSAFDPFGTSRRPPRFGRCRSGSGVSRKNGWLRGPEPKAPLVRTVKVRAGVWLVVANDGSFEVRREVEEAVGA